jgi:starch synthase (maltosyl-transferring)
MISRLDAQKDQNVMHRKDAANREIREGRRRLVIEGVKPEIDGGRFAIKRTSGEKVVVEADIFADGHDAISCNLLYRKDNESQWTGVPMEPLGNDRWRGSFSVTELGRYFYTLEAWIDRFESWRRGVLKKVKVNQDVSIELLVGAELIEEASPRASDSDAEKMQAYSRRLRSTEDYPDKIQYALDDELARLISYYPDRSLSTTYEKELEVVVDRERARFSSWYEVFPRSCTSQSGRHGTFKHCEERLAYIVAMGFDVLYLAPIHPIGRTHRKGKNNAPVAGPEDFGSPWAIGGEEGGHKSIHPQLGTLEDFRHLVAKAREKGIEIAIDLAFQCTPDHPYLKDHPEWFHWRPDGSVQCAENPPKKYEDIYPLNFETDQWQKLWEELKSIVLFWIDQGVHIFRVDNPHTKPFCFWEWLINEIKRDHPDVIFLSEAFTRPKVMFHLAKLGFTQSYTYFAWRNTKLELDQYFTELTQTEVREFFRPNLWPNTPDILAEYLQIGGRPAFMVRLVLAATLGANYGIYGPAFEFYENQPRELGSEEYLNSEKYEIRHWDITRPDSLRDFIARVNRIRHENPALQSDWSLRFHPTDNEQLICYSKHNEDLSNVIVVVVNLDPHHTHAGWVELPLSDLELDPRGPYQVHDFLSDAQYLWHGPRNYVELNPDIVPAHIFHLRRRVRTERDFDYYM